MSRTWTKPRASGQRRWVVRSISIILARAEIIACWRPSIQCVEHESRVHIDIETDDIPSEVARLEKLGASIVERLERWVVMQAPTGQRFCIVRVQRPGFPKNAAHWD
jgi:hypothetical protein